MMSGAGMMQKVFEYGMTVSLGVSSLNSTVGVGNVVCMWLECHTDTRQNDRHHASHEMGASVEVS